ncbi:succinate dehydrogenase [Francisella tularensis subsp. tularensis WY-00W4114]|nr:aldehyde dehydrogenase family protein [Francisella tularensis]AKH92802.1 succinate dehydrogenase [Francisella tularensis subsp. tularensis WY-00W4114]EKM84483.1 succinate semialdehyde dehydrogenase [Francisella tularensis subsp. tularensis AS_713]EKM84558.1 succinate semialdehyde dehydrogenase [Francisella tularensis subsp. tularensis 831]EKM89608.1 succinate semialdehyde dehydrogenase [Francisella tularensis subsp. tularensis 80700103]EKM89754.1 succinate semialdehyde dehydrogenase [Franci
MAFLLDIITFLQISFSTNIFRINYITILKASLVKLKQGNGLETDVKIGPLINKAAVEKVQQHVDDALAKGGVSYYVVVE